MPSYTTYGYGQNSIGPCVLLILYIIFAIAYSSQLFIGIILVLALLFILWTWSCYRLWREYQANSLVKFGSQIQSPQSRRNAEIYLSPTIPSAVPGGALIYRHWTLKPNAPKIAAGIQCLTMVIMLIALILDRWTQRHTDYGDIILGLVYEHFNGLSVELEFPEWVAGGAITLIWCLISMIAMCVLLHQTISICYGKIQYHESHYYLARLQVIQLWYAVLMWTDVGFINRYGFYGTPGPSFILICVCVLASWWMVRYFRSAIEFRPPPSAGELANDPLLDAVVTVNNPHHTSSHRPSPLPPVRQPITYPPHWNTMTPQQQRQWLRQEDRRRNQEQRYRPLLNDAVVSPPPAYQPPPAYVPHAIHSESVAAEGQIMEGGGSGYLPLPAAEGVIVAVPSLKRFCFSCGVPVPPHLQATIQFCSNCGTNLQ